MSYTLEEACPVHLYRKKVKNWRMIDDYKRDDHEVKNDKAKDRGNGKDQEDKDSVEEHEQE